MNQDKRTDAEIRTMPADRAMDCLIAERVFGYTLDYEFADIYNGPLINEIYTEDEGSAMLPLYSTDITDAWQVVKSMNLTRRMFTLEQLAEGAWVARFRGSKRVDEARGESEAAAICRAALLAVLR